MKRNASICITVARAFHRNTARSAPLFTGQNTLQAKRFLRRYLIFCNNVRGAQFHGNSGTPRLVALSRPLRTRPKKRAVQGLSWKPSKWFHPSKQSVAKPEAEDFCSEKLTSLTEADDRNSTPFTSHYRDPNWLSYNGNCGARARASRRIHYGLDFCFNSILHAGLNGPAKLLLRRGELFLLVQEEGTGRRSTNRLMVL